MTSDVRREVSEAMQSIREHARKMVYVAMDWDEHQISAMLVTIINVTENIDDKVKREEETTT